MLHRDLPPHVSSHQIHYDSSPAESSSPRLPSTMQDIDTDPDASEENIFQDMTFDEILEDLNARFLINLPREEMSLVRVYWQAEQAHWFYEDYLRPLNPLLPSYSQRNFTQLIIASSPLYANLGAEDYDGVWEEYCAYKRMVPCCGGILVNDRGDKCLMVRGWKSNAGWSFPRGKINLDESEVDCAIREVEEETGFDLTGLINPSDNITTQVNAQVVTMFIVKGIDEETVFETQTRMEIGAIEWVPLTDLPTWSNKRGPKMTTEKGKKKFYNVTPFVGPLKRWLLEHGINPNAKPKKQQAPTTSYTKGESSYESTLPVESPSIPALPRQSSALDHLFDKFIHKQEEDLGIPSTQAVTGDDTKAGLERLFGGSKDEVVAEKTEEEKEDDALARLLGAMGSVTPVSPPAELAPKQNRLLAVLNSNQPPNTFPSSSPLFMDANPETPVPSHKAAMLAVLSPRPDASMYTAPPKRTVDPTPSNLDARDTTHNGDVERGRKQRALLEQLTMGIASKVPPVVWNPHDAMQPVQRRKLPTPPPPRVPPPRDAHPSLQGQEYPHRPESGPPYASQFTFNSEYPGFTPHPHQLDPSPYDLALQPPHPRAPLSPSAFPSIPPHPPRPLSQQQLGLLGTLQPHPSRPPHPYHIPMQPPFIRPGSQPYWPTAPPPPSSTSTPHSQQHSQPNLLAFNPFSAPQQMPPFPPTLRPYRPPPPQPERRQATQIRMDSWAALATGHMADGGGQRVHQPQPRPPNGHLAGLMQDVEGAGLNY